MKLSWHSVPLSCLSLRVLTHKTMIVKGEIVMAEKIIDLVDVVELGFVRPCDTMKQFVIAEDEFNNEDLLPEDIVDQWYNNDI